MEHEVAKVMRCFGRGRKLRTREPPKANLDHLMVLANFPCDVLESASLITATTKLLFLVFRHEIEI